MLPCLKQLIQFSYGSVKEIDLPPEILLCVMMVHELENLLQCRVPQHLFAFKSEIKTQLSKAKRAEGERLLVSLFQLGRPIH